MSQEYQNSKMKQIECRGGPGESGEESSQAPVASTGAWERDFYGEETVSGLSPASANFASVWVKSQGPASQACIQSAGHTHLSSNLMGSHQALFLGSLSTQHS